MDKDYATLRGQTLYCFNGADLLQDSSDVAQILDGTDYEIGSFTRKGTESTKV